MTFWDFLDRQINRLPGWPNERQCVTIMIFVTAWVLLRMAVVNGTLWDVELFKIILQAVIISAIIGSIVAYHFAATNRHESEPTPVKVVNAEKDPVKTEDVSQ